MDQVFRGLRWVALAVAVLWLIYWSFLAVALWRWGAASAAILLLITGFSAAVAVALWIWRPPKAAM